MKTRRQDGKEKGSKKEINELRRKKRLFQRTESSAHLQASN
jgi:hypothetical protein